jgi:hypothetical protein
MSIGYENHYYADRKLLIDYYNSGFQNRVCKLYYQFRLILPGDVRWSCKEVQRHPCMKLDKTFASLILKSFELEINGDPANVEKGQFTKKPWEYSCTSWN